MCRDMSLDFLSQMESADLQEMLLEAGIENSVHRLDSIELMWLSFVHRHKLIEALDGHQEDLSDSGNQVAVIAGQNINFVLFQSSLPEAQYDVYLTYPRGKVRVGNLMYFISLFMQGEELASLIKIQLEVRGFAVFGDSHLAGCLLERNLSLVIRPSFRLLL